MWLKESFVQEYDSIKVYHHQGSYQHIGPQIYSWAFYEYRIVINSECWNIIIDENMKEVPSSFLVFCCLLRCFRWRNASLAGGFAGRRFLFGCGFRLLLQSICRLQGPFVLVQCIFCLLSCKDRAISATSATLEEKKEGIPSSFPGSSSVKLTHDFCHTDSDSSDDVYTSFSFVEMGGRTIWPFYTNESFQEDLWIWVSPRRFAIISNHPNNEKLNHFYSNKMHEHHI